MSMTNKRKEHVCLNQLEMSVFPRSNMIDDLLLLTRIIMLDTEHYRWHFIDTLHSLYVVSSVQCRLIWGTRNHWKQSKPATFVNAGILKDNFMRFVGLTWIYQKWVLSVMLMTRHLRGSLVIPDIPAWPRWVPLGSDLSVIIANQN